LVQLDFDAQVSGAREATPTPRSESVGGASIRIVAADGQSLTGELFAQRAGEQPLRYPLWIVQQTDVRGSLDAVQRRCEAMHAQMNAPSCGADGSGDHGVRTFTPRCVVSGNALCALCTREASVAGNGRPERDPWDDARM
jgi:hypothetical protein